MISIKKSGEASAFTEVKPLYVPKQGEPLRIVFFVSGGGGNLIAAHNLQKRLPKLISIELVISDRIGIYALDYAKKNGIPTIEQDFEMYCGIWRECKNDPVKARIYRDLAIEFHNEIMNKIQNFENQMKFKLDLAVLSYRRWIKGELFDYFKDRMINQHPGDLSKYSDNDRRKFTGINAVYDALNMGEKKTRTSTILVKEGEDDGEILCQGPWTEFHGKILNQESANLHENIQKTQSDWPAITFALEGIARGRFAMSCSSHFSTGERLLYFDGKPLPLEGYQLE